MKDQFTSSKDFSLFIENQAVEKGVTCLDALLDFCYKNKLEPDELTKWINKNLKSKLEQNFKDLNYIPKTENIFQ